MIFLVSVTVDCLSSRIKSKV